jgi:hypothetical protein
MSILFGASVNGKRRAVLVEIADLTAWTIPWKGGKPDEEQLDQIEMVVMNTEPLYQEFYVDAISADFDAELFDRTAEVI